MPWLTIITSLTNKLKYIFLSKLLHENTTSSQFFFMVGQLTTPYINAFFVIQIILVSIILRRWKKRRRKNRVYWKHIHLSLTSKTVWKHGFLYLLHIKFPYTNRLLAFNTFWNLSPVRENKFHEQKREIGWCPPL